MIDWGRTLGVSASLMSLPQGAWGEFRERLAAGPTFRNRPFVFAASPLILSAKAVAGLRDQVEAYHRVLEGLVRRYRENELVRAFFALPANVEALILAERPDALAIHVCRLDGYLTPDGRGVAILENNADAPAGTLFTGRINTLVTRWLADRLGTAVTPVLLDDPACFLEALDRAYAEQGGASSTPTIAILQLAGSRNAESDEMAAQFSRSERRVVVIDPRELELTPAGVSVRDVRIDLVWNKINTVHWNELVARTPGHLERWSHVLGSRAVCHVNSFGARYVAESKLAGAALQDAALQHLFEEHERALVRELLPWSRKLQRGEVVYQGARVDLEQLVLCNRHQFVLKDPYDIRGYGVTLGRTASSDVWARAVEAGLRSGAVVQEYVQPFRVPVVVVGDEVAVRPLNVSLDTFLFGGNHVGFGSKCSPNDKINIFQGGSKLPVLVA